MSESKQDAVARFRAVSRSFRDFVLNASNDELREDLESERESVQMLAGRSKAAIDRAFVQVFSDHLNVKGDLNAAVKELHRGLGVLVRLLRRREGLTEEELAERARISEEELRQIEFDPGYMPRPRTIVQLEDVFRLKPRTLAVLSGAVRVTGEGALRAEVRRFAASSSGMGKLSRDEKRLVNHFVRVLGDYTG